MRLTSVNKLLLIFTATYVRC